MTADEIEVGAVYKLDGQMRFPKKVLRHNRNAPLPGGRVWAVNVDGRRPALGPSVHDTWAGDAFARRVVEKIDG